MKTRIKAIYIKNLKMSEQKVASQVAHAVRSFGVNDSREECTIIVLKVSAKKFKELTEFHDCYIQKDLGKTEVEAGTQTAAAWIEVNDQTLVNYHNQGWNDESAKEPRYIDYEECLTGMEKVAYKTGRADYKVGDDIPSLDNQTEEEIIKKIKEQEVK